MGRQRHARREVPAVATQDCIDDGHKVVPDWSVDDGYVCLCAPPRQVVCECGGPWPCPFADPLAADIDDGVDFTL